MNHLGYMKAMPADFTWKMLNLSPSLQNDKSDFSLETKFQKLGGNNNLMSHLKFLIFIVCVFWVLRHTEEKLEQQTQK